MATKVIELDGSEDHIVLMKNGIAYGVIKVRKTTRGLTAADQYEAISFVGAGVTERVNDFTQKFIGDFAATMAVMVRDASSVEEIEAAI